MFFQFATESNVIVWVWPDCSQPRLWLPVEMMRRLGYDGSEVPDVHEFLPFVHPDDQVGVRMIIESVISGAVSGDFDYECRVRRSDGEWVWIQNVIAVVRSDVPPLRRAFGMARVMDGGRLLERSALKLTQDALHTVLNEIGHPVVLMTAEGRVVQANEATTRMVGRPLQPGQGPRYCPFLHEEDGTPLLPGFLSEVVRTGRRDDIEMRRFGRWWHMYLVPLQNAENEVRRVLLLAQDITSLKAQQAEQLAREKALTRTLVREVHHRIKNHLQGLVGLMRATAGSYGSAREALDAAVAQILTIATVHGLLAKDGQTTIDLAELVDKLVATLRVGSAIPLRFRFEPAQWQRMALSQEESVPLAAAIGELFTNAVKHTEPGPDACVEGRLSQDEQGVELDIVNTPARLQEGFSLDDPGGPHTGLDLVRALLPRQRSQLDIFQDGNSVRTRLRLKAAPGAGPT